MNSFATKLLIIAVCVCLLSCGGPAEREILIASKPGQATVKLDGADRGYTPLTVKVTGEPVVTVEKSGYISQDVALTKEIGPNVIVELEPMPKPKAEGYTTMNQIKRAYRVGDISRADYDRYKAEINRRRTVELKQAKQDLRSGKLTEGKYKQRVKSIKGRYEGN